MASIHVMSYDSPEHAREDVAHLHLVPRSTNQASDADPMGGVLPPAQPILLRDRLARGIVRVLLFVLFRIRIEGTAHIPAGCPVICTANHASWLDPFLMLALLPLPRRRYVIGNATSTLNPPWRRTVIAPFHTLIPLDRNRPQAAIRTMEAILARGNTLIIFPEGQTNAEGQVQPLQSGTAYLAQRTGCTIVPIGITGSGDLWLRKRITIRIGHCIDPSSYKDVSPHKGRQALLADLRSHIQALLVRQARHHGPKLLRRTLTTLF